MGDLKSGYCEAIPSISDLEGRAALASLFFLLFRFLRLTYRISLEWQSAR
jgi:hypothetical protein